MENKKENALNQFLGEIEPLESQENVVEKKKYIKNNNSIIERIDKIVIVENGKQLLREQY